MQFLILHLKSLLTPHIPFSHFHHYSLSYSSINKGAFFKTRFNLLHISFQHKNLQLFVNIHVIRLKLINTRHMDLWSITLNTLMSNLGGIHLLGRHTGNAKMAVY